MYDTSRRSWLAAAVKDKDGDILYIYVIVSKLYEKPKTKLFVSQYFAASPVCVDVLVKSFPKSTLVL